MRVRVFVASPEQFAQWVAAQRRAPLALAQIADPAAADGAHIFANSPCTVCHHVEGLSRGYIGPDLSHFGSRTTMAGGTMPNTPENVAQWITNPDHLKPGAQMPPLGLHGRDLDDLVAYLESLK